MAVPIGEGALDLDAFIKTPDPTFELIDPTYAPASLLDAVLVDTKGQALRADTPIGTVAVELYWKTEDSPDDEDNRADFFSALSPEIDPGADTNPIPTQQHPYALLPDGALYEVVVRTPFDAIDTEWSETRTATIGGKVLGTSLDEFKRAYPGVDVDVPAGLYTITATERTKPTLAIAARVENGEPLSRIQEVKDTAVRYRETLSAGFGRSVLRPDTAVAVINSRTTFRGNEEADRQRLEFRVEDGFQRTGEGAAENRGVVEIIVMRGEAVDYSDFTFTPYEPPKVTRPAFGSFDGLGGGLAMRGGPASFGDISKSLGGLVGGETHYRPPETVKVSMMGIRGLHEIAAFRFALAGMRQ